MFTFPQVPVRHLPRSAPVHGPGLDLHRRHEREEHCPREGGAAEGGDEDHGTVRRYTLAGLVHHMLHCDVWIRAHHATNTQGTGMIREVTVTFVG